jgi:hypothetical protein
LEWGLKVNNSYEWLFVINGSGSNILHLIVMHTHDGSYLDFLNKKIKSRSVLHDLAKQKNKKGKKAVDIID